MSASPSPTSMRPSRPTRGSSAERSSIATSSPTRVSRQLPCSSGRAGSSSSLRLREDTPVGRFLAKRGPGVHHIAYEVDDVAAALADLAACRRGADRHRSSRRPLRPAGRLCPPRRRPRRSHGGRIRCPTHLIPFGSRLPSPAARSSPPTSPRPSADALEHALASGSQGTHQLDTDDGRTAIVLGRVAYLKRFARDSRVGFGL